MIFSVFQKNRVFEYSWSTLLWYRCYYPHRSRDALSPVCGIFLILVYISFQLLWPKHTVLVCESWRLPFEGGPWIIPREKPQHPLDCPCNLCSFIRGAHEGGAQDISAGSTVLCSVQLFILWCDYQEDKGKQDAPILKQKTCLTIVRHLF